MMGNELFGKNKGYFMTKGVQMNILPEIVKGMLDSIMEMKKDVKVDYLQIFEIESNGNVTHITHRQEIPEYRKKLVLTGVRNTYTGKVYVIDDGEYVTVMLSDEY